MQTNFCCRWLLVGFLVVSPFFSATYARGGRGGGGGGGGGGSRGGGGYRGSSSRTPSRPSPSISWPAPAPAPRPAPAPAPRPAPAPAPRPAPAPAPRPAPAPAPRPVSFYNPPAPKIEAPVVIRQPAFNPNFKETNPGIGIGDRQPAYNPNFNNYKLDGSRPVGPPPPYSPVGYPVPNAPVGLPPSYQSLNQQRPYLQQPPPYKTPALPGRPPAYPGLASPNPAQPGSQLYPKQPELNRPYVVHPPYPGVYQPSAPRPYPVQPGFSGSHQPNAHKPYPVQPGFSGSHQPNTHRPYPVQPAAPNPHPVANRPYPPQTLGGNVWQPNYGSPAPSYMNYGGIPTGTNMHIKPHKKKGFIGSLMSLGKNKSEKKNKYYGSYPSPYGVGSIGKSHGENSFLGKHGSSPAMYSIFPYMAAKKASKIRKPKFGFFPMYTSHSHYHHHHHRHRGDSDSEYASYSNVYDDKYAGKCQQPIKKKHSKVNCSGTFDELQCVASCEEGYKFPNNTNSLTNKCWHITGVWKPTKNFPDCMPVCNNKCLNGGECAAPDVCKCPAEYRGSLCQFHFLECNILKLIKDENLRWVCMHHKNETICQVRCKATMEFDFTPPTEYRCTPDGVWKPDTLPQCDSEKQ